jgi:hypothetical protein
VDTKICLESYAEKQGKLVFPSPEKFAASAINTVGIASLATGYWPHEFQVSAKVLQLIITLTLKKKLIFIFLFFSSLWQWS